MVRNYRERDRFPAGSTRNEVREMMMGQEQTASRSRPSLELHPVVCAVNEAGMNAGDLLADRRPKTGQRGAFRRLWAILAVLGPGQMVMLADTEVGSVITAAQSGARWGYSLLPLQFVLIPVLFVVQELTVRLGIFTGKGHGKLIREHYGAGWAWVSVGGMVLSILGAMVAEFSGVAGVGELFGVPRATSLSLAVGFLLMLVWAGSYRRVERIALALGFFEVAFIYVALKAHPQTGTWAEAFAISPWHDSGYRYLVAANIGAVIMPWMIFFQQSAVVDKRLRPEHLRTSQWDTAIGSVITQIVMAAVLVTTAATLRVQDGAESLSTVGQVAQSLVPYLGPEAGRLFFGMGILGAALIAIIVTSLAAAWGIGELTGYKHSLESRPTEAPWFYGVYAIAVVGSALLVAIKPDLIALNLGIEVMNALLLPLVLGFLVLLAARALPEEHRIRGAHLWGAAAICAITSGMGIWCALSGMSW
jgi:NRAMP (natural resistance-associated macrophage protein)-like metal ion transporter